MYFRKGKNYIRGRDLLPGGTYRDPYGEDRYSFVYPEKEYEVREPFGDPAFLGREEYPTIEPEVKIARGRDGFVGIGRSVDALKLENITNLTLEYIQDYYFKQGLICVEDQVRYEEVVAMCKREEFPPYILRLSSRVELKTLPRFLEKNGDDYLMEVEQEHLAQIRYLLSLAQCNEKVSFETVLGDPFSEKELDITQEYLTIPYEGGKTYRLVPVPRGESFRSSIILSASFIAQIRCLLRLLEVEDKFQFQYTSGEYISEAKLDYIEQRWRAAYALSLTEM